MVISSSVVLFIYAIVAFIAVIASISYIYHWVRFGTHAKITSTLVVGYIIITIVLLAVAGILLRSSLA